MGSKLGLEAVLYRSTGTYESPVWNEIPNVKDNKLNVTKGEADVSRRGSGGWKASVGSLKELSVEFSMVYRSGDADFDAIQDSFFNGTVLDLAAMDGDIETTGSLGIRFQGEVMSFSRNEQLTESIMYDVVIKPTDSDHPPEWMEI